jgi:hypothetical protein|tara:strand:- start:347 stop:1123 length:777 start_codon:yes stop_codon:yes gene_type:complete
VKISKIIIYKEPSVPKINLDKIKEFIFKEFRIKIEIRDNIFNKLDKNTCEKIASTRIFNLKKSFEKHNPTVNEILIELENKDMSNKEEMALYDGIELNEIIKELIPKEENNQNTLNIIFTNKLTCTFDQNDFKYHARTWIGSNPAIISTTGIIEAPAKPKQYYIDIITNISKESIEEIKKKYKGEFLEYNDPRLSDIVEGVLLQIIFYYETGDVFCENNQCRLFNAHWQKDLFISQIENKKICEKHEKVLSKMKNKIS